MHWIDKDPIAEAYFENLLNKIFSYIEVESKNPKHIIKLTEDDIFELADCDVWELLLSKQKQ